MKVRDKIYDALRDKHGYNFDRVQHTYRVKCFLHHGDGKNLVIYNNGRGHCFSRCGSISLSEMCKALDIPYEEDGITLEEYSQHFKIPLQSLQYLGFKNAKYKHKNAVEIPIHDEHGQFYKNYYRVGYQGQTHMWQTGNVPKGTIPYGLDKIAAAHSVMIVEGMTDYLTVLMAHQIGLTPLALLGTSQWRDEYINALEGKTVYVQFEKDSASFKMIEKIAAVIPDVRIIEFLDKDKKFAQMPKDANELYLSSSSVSEFIERLDAAKKNAVTWDDFQQQESELRIKEIEPQIKGLLNADNIVGEILNGIKAWGFKGSTIPPFIVYCAMTSRLLPKSISVFLEAAASTGKNAVIDSVLNLFPDDAFTKFDALSEKALFYDERDFYGQTIIMTEQDSLTEKGVASSLFRTAIDAKAASYTVTIQKPNGNFGTQTITKHFENLITTGILERDGQRSTRMLKIDVVTTPEQIREVLKQKGNLYRGNEEQFNYEPFKLFQEYLSLRKPKAVDVPFYDAVIDLLPAAFMNQPRMQRLGQYILSFTQVIALLNINKRTVTEDGVLVADIKDYKTARQFLKKVFEIVSSDSLNDLDRECYLALKEIEKTAGETDIISIVDIAEHTGKMRQSVTRNVQKLIKEEYFENSAIGKGKYNIRTLKQLKEQQSLPTAEEVTNYAKEQGAMSGDDVALLPKPEPEPHNNASKNNQRATEQHQLLREGSTTYVQLK